MVDSLEAALWCFFNGENIIEAIESAVNLGGDADTVAAICGGLAGTYWGWSALPDGWKSRLLIKEELEQLAAACFRQVAKYPSQEGTRVSLKAGSRSHKGRSRIGRSIRLVDPLQYRSLLHREGWLEFKLSGK